MVSYAQTMIYKHYTENKRSSNMNPTKAGDGLICTNNDLQNTTQRTKDRLTRPLKLGMVSYAQTMIYKHSTENKRSSNTNPTKDGYGLICTNNDLQSTTQRTKDRVTRTPLMLGMVSYAQTMIYKHSTENKRSSNTNPTKMEMVSYAQTMIYKTLHREKRSSNTNLTKAGDGLICLGRC
jgi:sRNA-binding regulator protein Hfq